MTISATTSPPVLELRGIAKRFGATRALDGVDLLCHAGEVHALLGENGAGKSTLLGVISGALAQDRGEFWWLGGRVERWTPAKARDSGIAIIHQHPALAPDLSVAQNIVLGIEKRRWGTLRRGDDVARRALRQVGVGETYLHANAGELSASVRQMVAIARALAVRCRLILLDEPTTSLTAPGVKILFEGIRRLKASGVAVIYISHYLEEALEVADTYTVLRDGRSVAGGGMSSQAQKEILAALVGRRGTALFPKRQKRFGPTLLEGRGLTRRGFFRDVNLEVREGEILGVAGLTGSGRSSLLQCLFGAERLDGGRLAIRGRRIHLAGWSISAAQSAGIDWMGEDRDRQGLAPNRPVEENLSLSCLYRFSWGWGLLQSARMHRAAGEMITRMGIRCASPLASINSLSGGNQQKVLLARLQLRGEDLWLLDEPTRGVDIASKIQIYAALGAAADAGRAIVVVSSYLPELLGLCDRIGVMRRGQLGPPVAVEQWREESLLKEVSLGVV